MCLIARFFFCLSVFEPNALSDIWRLIWTWHLRFILNMILFTSSELEPWIWSWKESCDGIWLELLCFALFSLWISCFIVLPSVFFSASINVCTDLPLKRLLVCLSICKSLAERAAYCGLVRGSFVFLLLSATLVFTLTHRNSSLVSVAFVSTLPSVDLRKHCTSSPVAVWTRSHNFHSSRFHGTNYFLPIKAKNISHNVTFVVRKWRMNVFTLWTFRFSISSPLNFCISMSILAALINFILSVLCYVRHDFREMESNLLTVSDMIYLNALSLHSAISGQPPPSAVQTEGGRQRSEG